MRSKKAMLTVLILFLACQWAWADTKESQFALFKRNISPVYNWGKNGVITIPKAAPAGKWNIYVAGNAQEAGTIQGDDLYLTAATLMVGTSDDVELGYTMRQFVWDDLDKTDLSMDTYSFKARILHLTDSFFPQISLGVNAISLDENDFSDEEDILFNPYLTATIQMPAFTDKVIFSVTGVAEAIHNEGESSQLFYSAGADLAFFDRLYLLAEIQGLNKEEDDYIVNAGARLRLGWFSIGAAAYNAVKKDITTGESEFTEDSTDFRAFASLNIPLGGMFKKKEKKEKKQGGDS